MFTLSKHIVITYKYIIIVPQYMVTTLKYIVIMLKDMIITFKCLVIMYKLMVVLAADLSLALQAANFWIAKSLGYIMSKATPI